MRIDTSVFDVSRWPIGASMKRPHLGCSLSPAMKITVDIDGVHFYCFKCNSYAFIKHEGQSWRDRKQREAEKAAYQAEMNRRGYALPEDFSHEIDSAGLAWLGSGGWTHDLITRYRIGWSDKLKRVVIPVHPEGYTARAVFDDQQPKYLAKHPGDRWWRSQNELDFTMPLIATEDVLSAGRVGQFVQAAALLGTPQKWLPPAGISHLVIWTDADTAGRKARGTITESCRWLRIQVTQIETPLDPKRLSNSEIEEVLNANVKFM